MTILQALNTEVGNINLASKYIVSQGLNPNETFSEDNADEVKLAKAYCFRAMISQPDFSEDGLSITLNRQQLIAEANRIFTLNGLTDDLIGAKPTISNGTGRW